MEYLCVCLVNYNITWRTNVQLLSVMTLDQRQFLLCGEWVMSLPELYNICIISDTMFMCFILFMCLVLFFSSWDVLIWHKC